MDITIYLPDLRGGGAERVMVTLCNKFAERGHSVHLVLNRLEGPNRDRVSSAVTIYSLDAPRLPGYHALGALPYLVRYLRNRQPDVMLSAITRTNIVAILARLCSRVDVRLVVSERNNLSTRMERHGGLRYQLVPKLVSKLYPYTDAITAVSGGVADDVSTTAEIPRENITVVHNPSVTDEVIEGCNSDVSHPWFSSDVPVIIGVGSLTEQKGFKTLLTAFARLRRDRDARLVILGEGPEKTSLENTIKKLGVSEDVDLPGFVDNPYPYMRKASVFVLSSQWEGLPNVVIEAMACGTPVVATDCPSGPREILEDGKHGTLVPVGDDEEMAAAIERMLEDPTPEEQLLERAKAFRPDPITEQYLSVLCPDD